ncbi:MAG: hypothetical protein ACK5SI_13840 [Planctomycetia bacterium]|jgi:hypothetical protein
MTTSRRHQPATILPLHRPSGLHALLADIVGAAARRQRDLGGGPVEATLDVAAGLDLPVDPRLLRGIVAPLVAAAFAASAVRDRRRPGCGEVVVTAVAFADRVEIEVADSGDADGAGAAVADLRGLVERAGGTLGVARCPEGGMAYTLCLPGRLASSRAA